MAAGTHYLIHELLLRICTATSITTDPLHVLGVCQACTIGYAYDTPSRCEMSANPVKRRLHFVVQTRLYTTMSSILRRVLAPLDITVYDQDPLFKEIHYVPCTLRGGQTATCLFTALAYTCSRLLVYFSSSLASLCARASQNVMKWRLQSRSRQFWYAMRFCRWL